MRALLSAVVAHGLRALVPVLCLSSALAAQDPAPSLDDLSADELRTLVQSLSATVDGQSTLLDELNARLEALEADTGLELEDLALEVELLNEELDEAQSTPSASLANAFNPQITVFGNAFGRMDDREVTIDEGGDLERIDDSFWLREVEVDFRAAIDPYADAVVTLAYESEVPGEFESIVEEGYVLLKRLPILDSAPAGLKLKAGLFRSSFGHLNRVHTHDLPWPTRPRSLQTFLGEEGFAEYGLSGSFFLPSFSEHDVLEATVEVLGGGDIEIDPEAANSDFSAVGRLSWFRELGDENDLTLGLSTYQGGDAADLFGADLTWRWRPLEQRNRRSLVLGAEAFQGDFTSAGGTEDPNGGYAYAQYQLSPSVYAGVRYDTTESLDGPGLTTDTYGAYLSYYTSEFLRLRVGAEHVVSDIAELDGLDSAFVELNFVFGSHPIEPYWVNR